MSHQDANVVGIRLKGKCLQVALQSLLAGVNWSNIRFRDDCTWTPRLLAATALLWAWSDESTLVDRFTTVRSIIVFIFSLQRQLAESYQAFLKMLVRWTDRLVSAIRQTLQERLPRQFADCWSLYGFIPFGGDGSRVELPRTQSNEQAYSAARKSKPRKKKSASRKHRKQAHSRKANSPQMWLTTLWHIGTGLPWNWRSGPADSSERAHLLDMLGSLPAQALIVADAGFVGYEFARAILDSGRQLLIRVGSNIRLLRHLGCARESGSTVYLWPNTAARQDCPPLVLRLVVVHNGKHPVYLVTSVLSERRLSDTQVVELYRRRWGIELFYRHLKQTFQKRKLRSASSANARVELEWSMLGLKAMGFYALIEARRMGTAPARLSVAGILKAYRRTMRDYRHPAEHGWRLCRILRTAIIDSYVRPNKSSRHYPRKKQESPPGCPKINDATQQQIERAKAFANIIRKGLTA